MAFLGLGTARNADEYLVRCGWENLWLVIPAKAGVQCLPLVVSFNSKAKSLDFRFRGNGERVHSCSQSFAFGCAEHRSKVAGFPLSRE
jgi:hypothetical protein